MLVLRSAICWLIAVTSCAIDCINCVASAEAAAGIAAGVAASCAVGTADADCAVAVGTGCAAACVEFLSVAAAGPAGVADCSVAVGLLDENREVKLMRGGVQFVSICCASSP